jgi:hypothetical protein
MTEYTLNENKDYGKKILRKVHRISDKTFVVIDETLVKRLALDQIDDTWFEQELAGNGILLKIYQNSSGNLKSMEQLGR